MLWLHFACHPLALHVTPYLCRSPAYKEMPWLFTGHSKNFSDFCACEMGNPSGLIALRQNVMPCIQALKGLLKMDPADYGSIAEQSANPAVAANAAGAVSTPGGVISPTSTETPVWAQQTSMLRSESPNISLSCSWLSCSCSIDTETWHGLRSASKFLVGHSSCPGHH